ncbi:MAG: hypothetical protein HUU50_13415 [Candidatus Brocadiae bacterium]|nr:hypothetical protein [Candidatus Brocadiia bacterium]
MNYMFHCYECNKKISINAKFCPNCGGLPPWANEDYSALKENLKAIENCFSDLKIKFQEKKDKWFCPIGMFFLYFLGIIAVISFLYWIYTDFSQDIFSNKIVNSPMLGAILGFLLYIITSFFKAIFPLMIFFHLFVNLFLVGIFNLILRWSWDADKEWQNCIAKIIPKCNDNTRDYYTKAFVGIEYKYPTFLR